MARRFLLCLLVLGCRAAPTAPVAAGPEPAAILPAPPPEPEPQQDGEPTLQPEETPPPAPPLPSPPDPDQPELGTVIVSSKLVRKSLFAANATRVFDALPDFAFQRGGLEPIHDLDYVMMTTSHPTSPLAVTVVTRYRIDDTELVAAVDRAFSAKGETVAWSDRDGKKVGDPSSGDRDVDTRVVVLAPDKFAAFIHPALLPKLDGHIAELREFGRKHKLTSLTGRADTSGMNVVPPFPPPKRVTWSANASNRPTLTSELTFENAPAAEKFETWFRVDLRRLVESSLTVKLVAGALLDRVDLDRKASKVALQLKLEKGQAATTLDGIANILAKVAGLPPDERQRRADARKTAWERRKQGRLPPSAGVPAP